MQLQRHGSDQAQCRTARMNRWWCARWRPLSSARFSPGRPRSIPGRQGRGDRSAAPPTGGVTPADRPAPLHPRRPDDPGDTGEAAAPRSLANLPGRSVDSASLAPRADPPTLDVPSQASTRRALDPEVVDLVLRLGHCCVEPSRLARAADLSVQSNRALLCGSQRGTRTPPGATLCRNWARWTCGRFDLYREPLRLSILRIA
jgi:hypothetical protein